jgi:hypothetical protein
MPKSFRKMARKAGLPPGSLIYTGEKGHLPAKVTITCYNENNFVESELGAFVECLPVGDPDRDDRGPYAPVLPKKALDLTPYINI